MTTTQTKFPPTLLTPHLNMVELLPALTPSQEDELFRVLEQYGTHDTDSFILGVHQILHSINNDLQSLLILSYGQFWALITGDKSIIQSLKSILLSYSTYLPSTFPESMTGLSRSTCIDLFLAYEQSQTVTSPAKFFSQGFDPSTATSGGGRLFQNKDTQTILSQIYQRLLLVLLRISTPQIGVVELQSIQDHTSLSSISASMSSFVSSNIDTASSTGADASTTAAMSSQQHSEILTSLGLFTPPVIHAMVTLFASTNPQHLELILRRLLAYDAVYHHFVHWASHLLQSLCASELSLYASLVQALPQGTLSVEEYRDIAQNYHVLYEACHVLLSATHLVPEIMGELAFHPLSTATDDLSQHHRHKKSIGVKSQLLQVLIRLFDVTLPTLAWMLHRDLETVIMEQELAAGIDITRLDEYDTSSSTTTTTTTTTTSSSTTTSSDGHKGQSSPQLSSPFSLIEFRSLPLFAGFNAMIVRLVFYIMNNAIFRPLGMDIPSELFGPVLYPYIDQYQSNTQQDQETNDGNGSSHQLSQSNRKPATQLFRPSGVDGTISVQHTIQLVCTLLDLLTPQENPLSSSSAATAEAPQTPYVVYGSLFYYLPLSHIFQVLTSAHKTVFYSGARPTLPIHIPLSVVEVVKYIHSSICVLAGRTTNDTYGHFQAIQQCLDASLSSSMSSSGETTTKASAAYTSILKRHQIATWIDLQSVSTKRVNLYELCLVDGTNTTFIEQFYPRSMAKEEKDQQQQQGEEEQQRVTGIHQRGGAVRGKQHWKGLPSASGGGNDGISTRTTSESDQDYLNLSKQAEEALFQKYLQKTGRKSKAALKKEPAGQLMTTDFTKEEKEIMLYRYRLACSTYDDEYDDGLDDFRGIYSNKDTSADEIPITDEDIAASGGPGSRKAQQKLREKGNQPGDGKEKTKGGKGGGKQSGGTTKGSAPSEGAQGHSRESQTTTDQQRRHHGDSATSTHTKSNTPSRGSASTSSSFDTSDSADQITSHNLPRDLVRSRQAQGRSAGRQEQQTQQQPPATHATGGQRKGKSTHHQQQNNAGNVVAGASDQQQTPPVQRAKGFGDERRSNESRQYRKDKEAEKNRRRNQAFQKSSLG